MNVAEISHEIRPLTYLNMISCKIHQWKRTAEFLLYQLSLIKIFLNGYSNQSAHKSPLLSHFVIRCSVHWYK